MGIPLFYNLPNSSRPQPESTVKADASASTRSPIRRQRTIRHPPTWSASRLSLHRRGRAPLNHSPLAQWESLGHGSDRESSREPRATRDSAALDEDSRLAWQPMGTAAASLRQRELMRFIRQNGRPFPLPRELPPSEDPGSPWSDNEGLHLSTSTSRTNSRPARRPSFTPRFAPAYPAANDSLGPASMPPLVSRSEEADAHMPLLRRVGHRSINEPATGTLLHRSQSIDGLGDRERSFSPDDDNESHDMWETLLTTIRPDDNLPSADSSFTSATASASNALSGNSADSSQTGLSTLRSNSPRLPAGLDPFPDFIPHCDISSSEDSDTEPESDTEHDGFPSINRGPQADRNRQTGPNVLQHASLLGADTQSASARFSRNPEDLRHLRAIVDRLARRDDLSDEWWASVGLSRILSRDVPGISSTDNEERPREHL